jgi:hypothetical protein
MRAGGFWQRDPDSSLLSFGTRRGDVSWLGEAEAAESWDALDGTKTAAGTEEDRSGMKGLPGRHIGMCATASLNAQTGRAR